MILLRPYEQMEVIKRIENLETNQLKSIFDPDVNADAAVPGNEIDEVANGGDPI